MSDCELTPAITGLEGPGTEGTLFPAWRGPLGCRGPKCPKGPWVQGPRGKGPRAQGHKEN